MSGIRSSTRFESLGSLVSLAIALSACADGAALTDPGAAELERLNSPTAKVVTCDVTWKDPVSGVWTDATKWSGGAVPNASQGACINVPGTYTVSVRGTLSVGALAVGAAGNTGLQMLSIEGIRPFTTGSATSALLTVGGDVDNAGTIRMTSTGSTTSGNATLVLTNGVLTNASTGLIETLAGSAGGRNILADIVNDGTIEIDAPTQFSKTSATYTNNGSLTVLASRSLTVSNGGLFKQSAGTLVLTGTYNQPGGAFGLDGGVITGIPTLNGVALDIGAGSTAQGTVRMIASSSITGDVMPGQTILIEGIRPFSTGSATSAQLTASESFTNSGTLRLLSTGSTTSGNAALVLTDGVLTNASTGLIETLAGSAGGRNISADIVNDGTIEIGAPTQFSKTSAMYTNNGSFTVLASQSMTVSNGGLFKQAAGTLVLTGTYNQSGGGFRLDGGVITGIPTLNAVALDIGAGSTAQGTVRMIASSSITGDVMPGQTILIEGIRPFTTGSATSAELTANGSFTNSGTIRLLSTGVTTSGTATLTVASGTLTNAPVGIIETLAGSGGGRVISGLVVNDGTIDISVGTQYSAGTLRNVAPGTIIGGGQLTLQSAATFFGTGNVTANLVNSGQFNVGESPGALNITGTFTQTATGSFNVEIGGTQAGVDFDVLRISGAASIVGTLNVIVPAGACSDDGTSYEFMTFASRTNDFATKNGLNPGGVTFQAVPGTTNYRLVAVGSSCQVPDTTPPVIASQITGTLGNSGWYVSDVTVSWQVTDPESEISSSTGCGQSQVTADNAGITFTCSATSAGGTNSSSVSIKRDATAPLVQATRAPNANAFGWNNSNVTATFAATDATSGVAGVASASLVLSSEGANQSASRTFTDLAGNTAAAQVDGISIDKTAPAVSVSRQPPPDADGWNSTDVTVTYSATDALSGVVGEASVTQVFSTEGENQGGSQVFTDRASNSATATVTGINIRRPPPPPPPPHALPLTCHANPPHVWPPNGKLVSVTVSLGTTDGTAIASFTLRSATSSAANHHGQRTLEGFRVGTADTQGWVRAIKGAVYTFVYDAADAADNRGECTVTVTVTHDQKQRTPPNDHGR